MTAPVRTCPVTSEFHLIGVGPVPSGLDRYDELRDTSGIWWVDEPRGSYWMVLDRELVLAGLQDPETFSSVAIMPLDPEPMFSMKPIMLDPPEHGKWRQLLASYFAPRRMPQLEQRVLALCTELLDELAGKGSCDFVSDFALRFPTTIFLEIVGLPADELDTFLEWEAKLLHPDEHGVLDLASQLDTIMLVMARFGQAVADRRAHPDPDASDIVSHATHWTLDGEPVSDDDILQVCLLLFMAGLDTVASELSFAMHHLATHPQDRARLAADPEGVTPAAVEELLRVYPIPQLGRKVTRDVEFGGQQLRAGDMVLFSISAANRDPAACPHPSEVQLDREDPPPHYAFGAGPHRCLGSHLARQELLVALREWHVRIPDYRLGTSEPIREHRGAVHGLTHLPLAWS